MGGRGDDGEVRASRAPILTEGFGTLSEWFESLSEEAKMDYYDSLFATLYEFTDEEGGIYEQARQSHIESESQAFQPDYRGLVNFRDALHHLSRFFNAATERQPIDALVHLFLAKDHLERAAYDGQKRNVELLIRRSDEEFLPPVLYKLAGLAKSAPTESDHAENMNQIKTYYDQGRLRHSPEPFEEAEKYAQEYYESIPDPGYVLHRLLVRTGAVVGTIAGIIAIWRFFL